MDWIDYAYGGGTVRNQPLSPQLLEALSFVDDMGLGVQVFSGGQPAKGSGGARVGSTRHDHGNAADIFLTKDGQRLDWANPEHLPIFTDFVGRAREAGLTGIGAGEGYMQPGSMHVGFGAPAVWGAGGRGANAPDWLRAAYGGASAPAPTQVAAAQPAAPVSAGGGNPTVFGGEGGDTMQPPERGFRGLLGDKVSDDFRDRLMMSAGILAQRPGLQAMASARMADRQQQGQATATKNKTVAWLRSPTVGRNDLADAVEAGALPPVEAMRIAWQPAPEAKPANVEVINGVPHIINPDGSVTPSPGFTAPPPKLSAADEEIQRLVQIGVPYEDAVKVKEGVFRVTTHPEDGTVQIVDLTQRRVVWDQGAQGQPAPSVPTGPTAQPPSPSGNPVLDFGGQQPANADDAFGIPGMLRRGANTMVDAITGTELFPETGENFAFFGVLREDLMNDMAQAYDRPPSWLLQALRDLTPAAGTIQGPATAQRKLRAMRDKFATDLQTAQASPESRDPDARAQRRARIAGLESAIARVDSALGRFGGGTTAEDDALIEKYLKP